VRRGITFLIVRYFSEKCEWARTSQTLARVRLRPKNHPHLPEEQVRRLKPLPLHLLLPLDQPPPLHQQLPQRHLHPAVRREQHPPPRRGVRLRRRQLHRRPARLQPC
jgi:hypothetical protein